MDTIQTQTRHLTNNQIKNIQEHLEKLTSIAGNKWTMEILQDLYNKEIDYDICEVVENTFEGNVYNFMKWLEDNTVKSQKVLLTSKMLVIGTSEHQIPNNTNPEEYKPLIDFSKFNIEKDYDTWREVIDKEIVEEIRLKDTYSTII